MLACWIGRDDGFAFSLGQPVPQFAGVIGAIGDEPLWDGYPPEQWRYPDQIVGLSGRHGEGQGAAKTIGYGMNFGRPSAARSTDGLFEVPPFAPAAERCALTWVESTAVVLITPLDPLRA